MGTGSTKWKGQVHEGIRRPGSLVRSWTGNSRRGARLLLKPIVLAPPECPPWTQTSLSGPAGGPHSPPAMVRRFLRNANRTLVTRRTGSVRYGSFDGQSLQWMGSAMVDPLGMSKLDRYTRESAVVSCGL